MADPLSGVLERSRALGFLGPGAIEAQRRHSLAFAAAWAARHPEPPAAVLDLGSGGGVPGLVLAAEWPSASVVLLDAAERRCQFLREAIAELALAPRCEVAQGRAEALARDPGLAHRFDLVVARSFGPPGAVAECAAGFLARSGALVVAEPPDPGASTARWPADGLAQLGLGAASVVEGSAHLVWIDVVGPCDDRFPRRDGVPAKRPLF